MNFKRFAISLFSIYSQTEMHTDFHQKPVFEHKRSHLLMRRYAKNA